MKSRSRAAVRSFIVRHRYPRRLLGVAVLVFPGLAVPGLAQQGGDGGAAPGGAAPGAASALPLPSLLLL